MCITAKLQGKNEKIEEKATETCGQAGNKGCLQWIKNKNIITNNARIYNIDCTKYKFILPEGIYNSNIIENRIHAKQTCGKGRRSIETDQKHMEA